MLGHQSWLHTRKKTLSSPYKENRERDEPRKHKPKIHQCQAFFQRNVERYR